MDNYLAEIVILLALVVLVLVIAVFALARQIGVLHTRLAPAGALMTTAGPKVGEPAPLLSIPDLNGNPMELGGQRKLPQLLLFVSPTCPVCRNWYQQPNPWPEVKNFLWFLAAMAEKCKSTQITSAK